MGLIVGLVIWRNESAYLDDWTGHQVAQRKRGVNLTRGGLMNGVLAIDHVEIRINEANASEKRAPRKLGFVSTGAASSEITGSCDTGVASVWVVERSDWMERRC